MTVVELSAQVEPLTPQWWLRRLLLRLSDGAPHYDMLDRYYDGDNGIPVGTTKAIKDAYLRLMRMARMNYAELIVDAVRERMIPSGFRTGASNDRNGDAAAWDIWQGNSLDADCNLVHTPMLAMGAAYAIVGPVDPDLGVPLITAEDPRQTIVEHVPGRRRVVRAALKVFRDDAAQLDVAYLYLRQTVYTFVRERATVVPETHERANAWLVQGGLLGLGGWLVDNVQQLPAAVGVPVVSFLNNPDTNHVTRGEYEVHRGVLDRINYMILQRLEVATLQAFRQRAVKGVPDRDEHGVEINYDDVFALDPAALWILPETADIWESGVVDLGPIRSSVRDDVQDLAACTRTPLYYLIPDTAQGSAEGALTQREAITFKVADRDRTTGESWEQVMSLAFAYLGDAERAARRGMECLWQPPERFSLAQRADAAVKAQASGVPWRTIMEEIWQFSPQQVDRMETQRAADLFAAQLRLQLAPTPTEPASVPVA